jgi:phosphoribosylaminoimidazole-succinocarboxamide synthase
MYESKLASLPLFHQGKVRDIYEFDNDNLLIVTTDRLSAFDVVLPDPIPEKGLILNEISNFWFARFRQLTRNHLSTVSLEDVVTDKTEYSRVKGRAMVVRKVFPLPIEAVVRGYLAGSAWAEYQETGRVCGISLGRDLRQAEQLPEPIFTPATKASVGEHDENISFREASRLIGEGLALKVRELSLALYNKAASFALERGIIIADTKFEFGLDDRKQLYLIDEVLTPDSSRFWLRSDYRIGSSPKSFDKQFVRDYLESLGWSKTFPGPSLPEEIRRKTAEKYQSARDMLIVS